MVGFILLALTETVNRKFEHAGYILPAIPYNSSVKQCTQVNNGEEGSKSLEFCCPAMHH